LNLAEIESIVIQEVYRCIPDKSVPISSDSVLVGVGGQIDSIALIELCVGLEDRSTELGFEFDWTSDSAMSKSRSIFATVEDLAKEIHRQMLASS
jgi:acyl carrier protein